MGAPPRVTWLPRGVGDNRGYVPYRECGTFRGHRLHALGIDHRMVSDSITGWGTPLGPDREVAIACRELKVPKSRHVIKISIGPIIIRWL